MLTINTNLSSLIAQSSMKASTNKLNEAIERMTTGFKINHAKDNAANYAISTNMTTEIGSLDVAEDNTSMGLDLVNTASDNLSLLQERVQRLRDLQEQANNGTYGAESLAAINKECNSLVDEINRLYETTQYNGITLFMAPITLDDGRTVIAKESDAELSTTFKELDVSSKHFEIYDLDNNLVQAYDLEENDTVNDFLTTLQSHGFTTKLRDGEITISSNSGLYVAGDLATELGINTREQSYVTSTEQSYSVNVKTTSAQVSTTTVYSTTTTSSTATETINVTTTTESTQTNTVWTTTTTSSTQTIVTTATVEASTTAKFIKDILRLDTSGMTALSSVNTNANLADGTYKISTTAELSILAQMTNAGYVSEGDTFVLANDIDMSDCTTWTPIGNIFIQGNFDYTFKGLFDGNGYTIKSLNVTITESYAGLFGVITGNAIIKNLGIDNFNIINLDPCDTIPSEWGVRAGALLAAGWGEELSITNCFITNSSLTNQVKFFYPGDSAIPGGTPGSENKCAGLVAQFDGSIDSCYVENMTMSAIKDGTYDEIATFGGLVGNYKASNGVISDCYVKNIVLDPQDNNAIVHAGWLVGHVQYSNSYTNCYVVNGTGANALVGSIYSGSQSYTNCYVINNGTLIQTTSGYTSPYEHEIKTPEEVVVLTDEDISYTTTTSSTTATQTIYTTTTTETTNTITLYVTTTSSSTQTNTVWITSTIAATGGTTFEELGVSSAFKVTVVSDGTKSSLTIGKDTTFDEFFAQLESKGFGVSETSDLITFTGVGDMYLQSAYLNNLLSMSTLSKTEAIRTANTDSEHLVYLEELEDVYAPGTINLMVGTSAEPEHSIQVDISFKLGDIKSLRGIGLDGNDYLAKLDKILADISSRQVHFGAVQNRLVSVLDEIAIKRDNLISSRSTIRDADIAETSSTYIQQQILQQASATLLATANQSPSIALQLI